MQNITLPASGEIQADNVVALVAVVLALPAAEPRAFASNLAENGSIVAMGHFLSFAADKCL